MAVFVSVPKRRKKIPKKLSQFLKSHISGTLEAISLKLDMWSTEVGGRVHSKNRLKAAQSYGGAKIAFSFFLSVYSRVLRACFLGRSAQFRVC